MALPAQLKDLGIVEAYELADGDVLVYDATRGVFVTRRPQVRVFDSAASVDAAAPDFLGQMAVETDSFQVYVAVGITAGDFTLCVATAAA